MQAASDKIGQSVDVTSTLENQQAWVQFQQTCDLHLHMVLSHAVVTSRDLKQGHTSCHVIRTHSGRLDSRGGLLEDVILAGV